MREKIVIRGDILEDFLILLIVEYILMTGDRSKLNELKF